jgi:hypothetical protein
MLGLFCKILGGIFLAVSMFVWMYPQGGSIYYHPSWERIAPLVEAGAVLAIIGSLMAKRGFEKQEFQK